MTEEEFKKVMTRTIIFIVIAVVVLIVIGILVFNKSGKELSIFENQKEIDDYKQKVQEINLSNDENQEPVSDNIENEAEQENEEVLETNPEGQESEQVETPAQ